MSLAAFIIVDRPELQELLAAAVRSIDFEPKLFSDTTSALAAFADDWPQLVISSYGVSGLDGLSLCRNLHANSPDKRFLMLLVTNRSAPADLESLLDAGADDYLLHPVDPGLLRIRLRIAAGRVQRRLKAASAEHQLRESIERFELAVRGANDGLWDAQPLGRPWQRPDTNIWYSKRLKELLGFAPDEFPDILQSWESRLHAEDRPRTFEALTQHIDHRQPYDIEYRLQVKSGEYRWFSARGQAIWDEEGRLMRMAGSLRDITPSKENETKLEQSEAKWRSLVENAPNIIILADLDGTIRFINRKTPIAFESIGRTTYDYIDPEHRDVMRQAYEALRTTHQPQRYEVRGQTETGVGMLWYDNRMAPILHEGRVEAVVLIATDITHRKIAEEQLKRDRELLQRLLDLQERERQLVAYDIHDGLVQYLTGGLMHLEAGTPVDKPRKQKGQSDLDRGMSLLRDALAEARRLISGLRPPILDEQGVSAALEYLINESRPEVPDVKLVDRTYFGRLAAPLEVAIFRITQEALANVRHHSHSKRAQVELIQHGQWIRLSIRDWGCGFDLKTVHEERFGLQGIRQRARLLGSIATIESAPGKGTIIVVDFPLLQDPPPPPAPAPRN